MTTHMMHKQITEEWGYSQEELIGLILADLGHESPDGIVVDFSLDQAGCTARVVHKYSEQEG